MEKDDNHTLEAVHHDPAMKPAGMARTIKRLPPKPVLEWRTSQKATREAQRFRRRKVANL